MSREWKSIFQAWLYPGAQKMSSVLGLSLFFSISQYLVSPSFSPFLSFVFLYIHRPPCVVVLSTPDMHPSSSVTPKREHVFPKRSQESPRFWASLDQLRSHAWPQTNYCSQKDDPPSPAHPPKTTWLVSGGGVISHGTVEVPFQEEETQMLEIQAQEMAIVFNFCISFWKENFQTIVSLYPRTFPG